MSPNTTPSAPRVRPSVRRKGTSSSFFKNRPSSNGDLRTQLYRQPDAEVDKVHACAVILGLIDGRSRWVRFLYQKENAGPASWIARVPEVRARKGPDHMPCP